LGKDYSGNGNNWTPNNFSVTAGAGNDSLVDSPTSYGTDTGVGGTVRGNYATLNPLDKSAYTNAPTNGNLDVLNAGNFIEDRFVGTIGVSSGKWYFETTITGTYANTQIGIHDANSVASTNTMVRNYLNNGQKMSGTTASSYGNSFTTGDVIGVAFDMDSGKIWFSKNGTFQASGDPVAGTNAAFTDLSGFVTPFAVDYAQASSGTSGHTLNFGQRAFAYTAPSGFKALCTQNLPTPTIGATTATQASQYFAPVLYTGTGSNLAVTVGFQPDWIWTKARSAVDNNLEVDVLRGIGNILITNSTAAESAYGAFVSFDANGFTKAAAESVNGRTYVAWNWKANGSGSTNTSGSITSTVSANTTSGFSIVTYSGQSAAGTIGHGLGVAPSMIIVKNRSSASPGAWTVYSSVLGNTSLMFMNTTDAVYTGNTAWNSTSPTSSVFSVGPSSLSVNTVGNNFVAYCFAAVAGYSAFGQYTGNGSSDGTFVFTGFRPAYVMIKRTTSAYDWWILDSTRSPANAVRARLYANDSAAESSNDDRLDLLSNGFKFRNNDGGYNASGEPYIYMAFASNPFKYSLAR